jgi:urea transporter
MNYFMERSRGEIIMFAVAFVGVLLWIWGVILVSKWLAALAMFLTLGALIGFALRDSD